MNNYSKLLVGVLVAAMALTVVPSVSAAAATNAGTFVGPTDADTTYVIAAPAPVFFDIGFVDTNSDGSIQNGEPVYLTRDAAAPFKVLAGDVRLTGAYGKAGGSIVKGSDDDFDRVLDITPSAGAGDFCFYFFDADTNTVYNLGDWVAVHINVAACATGAGATAAQTLGVNDIVLNGASAFQQVMTSTVGYNSPLAVAPAAMVFTQIGFFNADGSTAAGVADYGVADTVYFNLAGALLGAPAFANIGDLRLTALGTNAAGVQLDATTPETTYTLAAPVAVGGAGGPFANLCYVDADGNGAFNAGEPSYLQAAACGVDSVAAGDLRLTTSASGQAGGTLVKGSDDDFARDTCTLVGGACPGAGGFGASIYAFFDSDGSGGYSKGDLVVLDIAAGGTVTVNDIVISGTGVTPFTTVASGFSGLNNAVAAGPLPAPGAEVRFDADGVGTTQRTAGDFVYLDVDATLTPTINDIRLTKVATIAAGTQVQVGEIDTQYGLVAAGAGAAPVMPAAWAAGAAAQPNLCFIDTDGDGVYDVDEGAYLQTTACATNIAAGSVRLVANSPYQGGTLVKGSDDDTSRISVGGALTGGAFCIYDASGDGAYSYKEPIIINAGAVCAASTTTVNDIFVTENQFAKVISTSSGLNNPHIAMPGAMTVAYYNADGITGFTTGDIVYLDMDGSGNPTVGDVRLTAAGALTGGQSGGVGGNIGGSGTTSPPATTTSPPVTTTSPPVTTTSPPATTTPPAGGDGDGDGDGGDNETPGFELVALVAALGAALVLVRRKL